MQKKGRHVITSAIEHHAVLNCCRWLGKRGFEVTILPVDGDGLVSPGELGRALRPDTTLVSIMQANNEVGVIEPIAALAKVAHDAGAVFHTDAVQAVGKIPVRVDELGVDLLSASAHKFYGPKGVGILYRRSGTRVESLQHGGHHERNLRAGTENVPGIVGTAVALKLACEQMRQEAARLSRLRDRLQEGIMRLIPDVRLNGHATQRLPHLLNVSIEGIEGESMLLSLDAKGVAVSTGSACTSGSLEPSHVLIAMGIPPEVAHGSLRFSLGLVTTDEDVDYVLEVLPPIVERLRAMSPIYKKGRP
jgi:cysteine desulfurase